jgi:hypothetical protein
VTLAQAVGWNVGTCFSMQREKLKRTTRKSLSTEARSRGGVARSSEEDPVTGSERRRDIVQLYKKVNWKQEDPFG